MSVTAGRNKYSSPYGAGAPTIAPPEYCSQAGAEKLKAKLEDWYRAQGMPVPEFRVEKVPGRAQSGAFYAVKSNIINVAPK
jgi:hypothetical protein